MNFRLFERMVRMPSPSGEERELALLLRDEMNKRGFRARIDRAGNMIASKGKGKPLFLLTAHMDTVPKQLPVKRTKTKLYGRGAVDTKGSLFSFIEAATRVEPKKGTVMVAGTVEEECPTSKGAHFLGKTLKPDYCIVGEPGGWNSATVGYKGVLDFTYSLFIGERHFSSEENASLELLSFINNLRDQIGNAGFGFNSVGLEVRSIDSDNARADARVVLRTPPGFDSKKAKRTISSMSGKASIEFQQELPVVVVEKNTPLTRAFLSSIRSCGGTPGFKKKTGTSDMNVFAQYWGCPMLTYGPGNSHLDHSDNEHIAFSEVENAVIVLEKTLESLL